MLSITSTIVLFVDQFQLGAAKLNIVEIFDSIFLMFNQPVANQGRDGDMLKAIRPKLQRLSPTFKIQKLTNGSEVVAVHAPNEVTSFDVTLILKVGSTIESPEQQGLLHLLEHVVPACFSIDGETLDRFSDRHGWINTFATSPGAMRFGFSVPDFGDSSIDAEFGPVSYTHLTLPTNREV